MTSRKPSEVYTRVIVLLMTARICISFSLLFVTTRIPRTRGNYTSARIMPDPDRPGVDYDSKEIRIPRNDLIRDRRTGIIITLLPISSETVETTGGGGGEGDGGEKEASAGAKSEGTVER